MHRRLNLGVRAWRVVGLTLLAACAPALPAPTPQVVSVSSSSAAYPWLQGVYECAPSSVVVQLTDPDVAELSIRFGEPSFLSTPAYQIGADDLLVVVHPQTGVGSLTPDQTRQVFAGEVTNWTQVGGADLSIQVWVFSPDEDVQVLFERVVMNDLPVTSLARLAVSAQAMSDSVGSMPGSIGLLPRRWKAGNTREAMLAASAPVLTTVKGEPQGALKQILHCLQAAH